MRKNSWLITLLFLILISLPGILLITGYSYNQENSENRKLERIPVFNFKKIKNSDSGIQKIKYFYQEIAQYRKRFAKYYEDNFSLKVPLLRLFYFIKKDIFCTDPLPHKAIDGEDGWMFLGNSFSDIITESIGRKTFSKRELNRITRNLQRREKWLADRGIDYFVAIAPNKHSIYGEFLPILKSDNPTKLKQLKTKLDVEEVNFVDLSVYLNLNNEARLFHKTNSHWNDVGAFWASQGLINEIQEYYPEVTRLNFEDFKEKTKISYMQDITKMLNVSRKEVELILHYKYSRTKRSPSILEIPKKYSGKPVNYEFRFKNDVNNLKILVFRDSFCSAMIKFLREKFGESVFIWHHKFDKKLIEKEKPDIVIHEIVERNIDVLLKSY